MCWAAMARADARMRRAPDKIVSDAIALDRAGAFAIVIEGVVEPIAIAATRGGILSHHRHRCFGAICDGQVLVTRDMLGMFERVAALS